MNNFSNDAFGYNKKEVNDFIEYVIKKTEENVITIKNQNDEIARLKQENERLKRLENSYNYINEQIKENAKEIKENALYERELIIKGAKDNASSIINDALLKAEKLQNDNEHLNKTIKTYKKKMKAIIYEQLESLDDIEVLE